MVDGFRLMQTGEIVWAEEWTCLDWVATRYNFSITTACQLITTGSAYHNRIAEGAQTS